MKISRLKIHNYRSIRELEMKCENIVVLLGPNNHGKSNILSAMEYAFSTSSKPTEEDFCAFRGSDRTLWAEFAFHELTAQEKTTFRRYLKSDGSISIRKTARITETGAVEISYNGYVEEPSEDWLKESAVKQLTTREAIAGTPLGDLVPSSGKLSQDQVREAQRAYIEAHREELQFSNQLENGPLLGLKTVAGGTLPDFYLIPAIRDLADETKVKNTTIFGKLLNRAVREMAESDPRFRGLRDELERLVGALNKTHDNQQDRPEQLVALENSLQTELAHWGVNVEIEVVPPVIEKIFELGTNLHLDDGVKTLAEQKGHGLQRAVIFALVRAWANALRSAPKSEGAILPRAASESIIFAMEEPELFLHPHAQRRFARAIRQISESPEHQVLICSHSPYFINLDHYKDICIVTKAIPADGTSIRQCTEELFEENSADQRKKRFHMANWINPDRGEMFFAKRIVFVEGETEKVLLPYLAEKLTCFDQEVSIIDCGSKHNLPLYIRIANAFKLPYVVIHDEDPIPSIIPDDWNDNKVQEKKRTFALNEEIRRLVDASIGTVEMLCPDFESTAGVSKNQGDKKGKPLAALDYFENKQGHEIPARLKEIAERIYC